MSTDYRKSRRFWERSCISKKAFPTKWDAFEFLLKYRKKGDLTEKHRVYKCPFCHEHHIGREMEPE